MPRYPRPINAMPLKQGTIFDSVRFLRMDPRFRPLIKRHGPPDFSRNRDPFRALVRAIVYQQISGKAASSILAKFLALFGGKQFPTPAMVLAMPMSKLRAAGLSNQKALYIKDLARKFSDGTIQPRRFGRMANDEIIAHLVRVKGIGVWTAHMFLLFTLRRPDILPTGDLGIRKGFQIVYELKRMPSPKRMEELARPWRQYASIASWYLWRAVDGTRIPGSE
ncbi:DNA-3-methyladenine glycosylase 2 family protein [Candidatus Parcubacteria bacterium]|nr:MAG: DNA-3-methyladenine glycosylase 2 family protein [Candidatus Parcubacteria bacterium]